LFKKPISQIETDFLQTICFFEGLDSTKDFVIDAIIELERRKIKPELYNLDESIIKKYESEYQNLNRDYLNNESFSVLELIWMTLVPIRNGISVQENETKKRKQRNLTILMSVIFYSITISLSSYDSEIKNQEYIEELKNKNKSDSLFLASQDWTGQYYFTDNEKEWMLNVKKENNKHFAFLSINDKKNLIQLNCSAVIKKYGIQIFPDTVIKTLGIYSHTNLLFELEKNNKDTLTWWYIFKPNNYDSINGLKGFKKTIANNS
jgi:hypothetical protein